MPNQPRWIVVYRESERLLANAFDQETVKVEAWAGPIYDPEPVDPED